jgi:hypothetical protein
MLSTGKPHARTGHESSELEQTYSSTLSLTSAPDGVGDPRYITAAFPQRMTRVGLRAGLDGCGRSRAHRDSTVSHVASRYTD